MEIKIISAQEGVNPIEYLDKVKLSNYKDAIYIYPERDIYHPKTLYNKILKETENNIEKGNSMLIITFSDHVLNAIRVAIKKNKFENAECIQILNNGDIVNSKILSNGRMDKWVEGIFDVWDNALLELL